MIKFAFGVAVGYIFSDFIDLLVSRTENKVTPSNIVYTDLPLESDE